MALSPTGLYLLAVASTALSASIKIPSVGGAVAVESGAALEFTLRHAVASYRALGDTLPADAYKSHAILQLLHADALLHGSQPHAALGAASEVRAELPWPLTASSCPRSRTPHRSGATAAMQH